MSAIKERLFGAVAVMSDEDAEKVWKFVLNNFVTKSWDDIEEVSPSALSTKTSKVCFPVSISFIVQQ